jgi:hypothetical protein
MYFETPVSTSGRRPVKGVVRRAPTVNRIERLTEPESMRAIPDEGRAPGTLFAPSLRDLSCAPGAF